MSFGRVYQIGNINLVFISDGEMKVVVPFQICEYEKAFVKRRFQSRGFDLMRKDLKCLKRKKKKQ